MTEQPSCSSSTRFKKCLHRLTVLFMVLLAACNTGETGLEARPTDAGRASPAPTTARPFSPTDTTPARTPTPEQRVELTDDDLRGAVIRFWHAWGGEGGKVVRELVDEFNLSNRWKILIVPVAHSSYDQLNSEIDISIAQRNPPDLVVAYLHQSQSWNIPGGPVELDLYANDPLWGLSSSEQADFYQVFWQQDVISGKRMGVPAQRSGQMLFYNRSWAEDLDFKSQPPDAQAFADQACASSAVIRKDEESANDNLGGWIIAAGDRPDYSAMLSWITSFGGEIFQPSSGSSSTRSPYHFETPQVEDAFTFLRELYDNACARFSNESYPEAEFASRGALFSTGSIMGIPAQKSAFTQAENQDRWSVLPFPAGVAQPSISVYGPSFQVLPSTPVEQLASWVFIKWMLTPENQARLVQVSSTFPLRRSVLDHLSAYQRLNPQWGEAVELLPYAQPEPAIESWNTVRWAFSDASTQLFRSYFTIDQVPNLLALLEDTAAELHMGPDLEEVFATPEPATSTTIP